MTQTTERLGAIALAAVLLCASCAYPRTTLNAGAAAPLEEAHLTEGSACAQDQAESFESGYRERCAERGTAGVAAESLASVLESMAELVGAKEAGN